MQSEEEQVFSSSNDKFFLQNLRLNFLHARVLPQFARLHGKRVETKCLIRRYNAVIDKCAFKMGCGLVESWSMVHLSAEEVHLHGKDAHT